MRAFVAIVLPTPLRGPIAAVQAALRAAGADVAWVEPHNLHLTLKFLGDVDEARAAALADALRAAVHPHPAFTIAVEGIGAFPSTRNPQVVWVGVSADPPSLGALAEAVDQTCAALGFPMETRPFAAHVTIGRLRSRRGVASLIKALQAVECPGGGPAPVDRVILVQSTLSSKGAAYTPLVELPLAGVPQRYR